MLFLDKARPNFRSVNKTLQYTDKIIEERQLLYSLLRHCTVLSYVCMYVCIVSRFTNYTFYRFDYKIQFFKNKNIRKYCSKKIQNSFLFLFYLSSIYLSNLSNLYLFKKKIFSYTAPMDESSLFFFYLKFQHLVTFVTECRFRSSRANFLWFWG